PCRTRRRTFGLERRTPETITTVTARPARRADPPLKPRWGRRTSAWTVHAADRAPRAAGGRGFHPTATASTAPSPAATSITSTPVPTAAAPAATNRAVHDARAPAAATAAPRAAEKRASVS